MQLLRSQKLREVQRIEPLAAESEGVLFLLRKQKKEEFTQSKAKSSVFKRSIKISFGVNYPENNNNNPVGIGD